MINKKHIRILLCSLAITAAIPLSACQTTSTQPKSTIDSVLERAENAASDAGHTQESLALLERLYKRNSDDPKIALKYAKALREAGHLNRANMVITPFAGEEAEPDASAKTEYASIQAALGNYLSAEEYSRQAILLNTQSSQAYHILGISLDAQGHHKQAEVAFRKAIDLWEGDPGPILNNLGLNLAAQGFLDEAVDTLRKAVAISPERTEIERNLRIVSVLQEQAPASRRHNAPLPVRKPQTQD